MLIRVLLSFAFFLICYSCAFEPVPGDQAGPDFASMGYQDYTVRVYAVTMQDPAGRPIRHDTVGQFSSGRIMAHSGAQYGEQWQFLRRSGRYYDVDLSRLNNSIQGTGVSDSVLFLHPPRFDYLKILQYCPYPYFRGMTGSGNTWDWDLAIGGDWAIDSLYPVRARAELFRTRYAYTGKQPVAAFCGKRTAYAVHANGNSRFGTSVADFYLCDTLGLVCYRATATNGLTFRLALVAKGRDTSIMGGDDAFLQYWHPPVVRKFLTEIK